MNKERPESIMFAEKIEAKNRYFFNIGFNGTTENVTTWREFQKMSKRYDNVFITTIRVLMDSYVERKDYDSLRAEIAELKESNEELRMTLATVSEELGNKEEKKVLKTFGK